MKKIKREGNKMYFILKPVEVEAYCFYKDLSGGDPPLWFTRLLIDGTITITDSKDSFYIKTNRGEIDASYGGFVIRTYSGDIYFEEETEFRKKYKRVKQ